MSVRVRVCTCISMLADDTHACVCTYVNMSMCVGMYVCVKVSYAMLCYAMVCYVCMYVVCVPVHACLYVCICACMRLCVCPYFRYVCMYVRMCVRLSMKCTRRPCCLDVGHRD